ncbi:integrator complex subunit 12-like isoform X1 [Neocloeon triangulifer]|uniref:integrator complex subunit 12-like isoform X1 n=1 Tax=Neocloeon triangulifer TaxID=2078957 RepID=UPI00286F7CF5|nr:integrator complex subunit 12-like isoform X1 [Neocloeon triangulifer]
MAAIEIDPDIRKAIRLMFSSAPDSTDLLRAMLEDAIKAKHGTSRSLGNVVTASSKSDSEMCIILDRDSENSGSEKDPDDDEVQALELEMMEEDLKCNVCKEMNVTHGNRLIECTECHELYHQECHSPTILNKEIDDPRKTWYCSSCKQATAEAVKQTTIKALSPGPGGKSLRSSPNLMKDPLATNTKPVPAKSSEMTSLFKRSERAGSSGASSSSASSSAAKTSGLAAMAASLQKSGSTSSKSSSGKNSGPDSPAKSSSSSKSYSSSLGSGIGKISSSSSVPSPTSSNAAADKRLQNMKKKAATKLQEKRKHAK